MDFDICDQNMLFRRRSHHLDGILDVEWEAA